MTSRPETVRWLLWVTLGNYQALSSWFNNVYLKELGIKAPRIVMYSLKATTTTLLDNKNTPELTMAQIAGHKYGNSEITKTYSIGKNVFVIQEAIESIDFKCLDDIDSYEHQGD